MPGTKGERGTPRPYKTEGARAGSQPARIRKRKPHNDLKVYDLSELKNTETLEVIEPSSEDEGKDEKKVIDPKLALDTPHASPRLPQLTGRSVFSMLGYSKPMRFRLTRAGTLTSGGGGAGAFVQGVYPSLFDQYTQLAGLFDEARLVSVKVTYAQLQSFPVFTSVGASALGGSNFALGYDASGTQASSTYTYPNTLRLPGSKVWSYFAPGSKPLVHNWQESRKGRPWSILSATPSGTDPVGGVIGAFALNAETTLSNATIYFGYFMEAVYDLRGVF